MMFYFLGILIAHEVAAPFGLATRQEARPRAGLVRWAGDRVTKVVNGDEQRERARKAEFLSNFI